MLSLVLRATPQHLRPTCHQSGAHHLVDHVTVGSPRVDMMPVDWLIQPEIGLMMTSHPGSY